MVTAETKRREEKKRAREDAFCLLNKTYHVLIDGGLDELADQTNNLQRRVGKGIPAHRQDMILSRGGY